jgi:hypothetical protein
MPRVENHQVDLPENSATSRRRLLTSLLAGGAFAAAAPMLASRASAADDATATTVAPPNRDAADNDTLNALVRREAQMVATYASAIKVTKDTNDVAALTLIHDHHLAYQQALVGYLGNKAVDASGATALASASGSFSADANQLAGLEAATMNMHIDALSTINGLNAATLIASIITMEARHSAALALVSGLAPLTAAGN